MCRRIGWLVYRFLDIFANWNNLLILIFLGKDSCGGDSGGPLIQRARIGKPWFQVGVVSFGTKTCGIGVPGRSQNFISNNEQTLNFFFMSTGVYTKVAAFIPWIEKNLKP